MNFQTRDEFIYHLQKDHSSSVTEDEVYILSEISVKSSPLLIKFCPLCVIEPQRIDLDPEVLLDHIGDHVHEFSLLSLPWKDTPDPNIAFTVLNLPWIDFSLPGDHHPLSSNTINILHRWFDCLEPGVQEYREQWPAYPSEETIKRAETLSAEFIDSPSTKELGRIGPSPTEAYFSESGGDASHAQPDLASSFRDSLAWSEPKAGEGYAEIVSTLSLCLLFKNSPGSYDALGAALHLRKCRIAQ